ncbi:MAG: putative manganese-dependent inorganic diphosphatase [Treponema sp.]|jgi:manganese-dependent inorganic pyrophosphatase|nr:putative manganese-dependent inorganic diphosphatase [Treponema sp.]
MKQTVYVIGHRNPDTDSVVSAAAYAALKQAQGHDNYRAARAGNLNPQTEYIFERFNAPVPEYLPDLIPKTVHYLDDQKLSVNGGVPLWDALELMEQENLRVLPVTDSLGVYKSMLHYRAFSRYIITHINPRKKTSFPVSIDNVTEVLRAQPITLSSPAEVIRSSIVIAASYNKYFTAHLEDSDAANALVIMGDRLDLQAYCIEKKVRALILSNGHTLSPELTALAKKNGVSVLSSPFDTSSTAMLIIYSVPVETIGDSSVPLAYLSDPITKIRPALSRAPSRCLPVGDSGGHIAGVLFEGDLLREPNIGIVMVDHNEPAQAIEGIENYRILEVIDHHRLGNFSTRYPITFINKPVGATCTIITDLYREQRAPMKKEIASALLCGILADTLSLKSATTSGADREAADYLESVTGLEAGELSRELSAAADRASALSAAELISLDMKEYTEGPLSFMVSQVETSNPSRFSERKEEILEELEKSRGNRLFAALLVTDTTALDSLLFITGEGRFLSVLNFPKTEKDVALLKGVVSRKKQLVPLLTELIEKMQMR